MTHTLPSPVAYPSFVRFITRSFAFLGFLFGLVGLVGSMIGMHVFFTFGPLHIEGLLAGILGVGIMPICFTLVGAVVGTLVYLPIRLLLWLLWR